MIKPGDDIEYPCSDGLPMADKDVGRLQMEDIEFALSRWFKDDPMVYVSANLLLYFVKGSQTRVAPDVFVAKGVPKHERDTYKLWEEGVPPTVAFEFTSRSSRHLDPKVKVPIYQDMGVEEIYLFDPEGTWLSPRFKAIRKTEDGYQDLDVLHGLTSPALGLDLRIEHDRLRLYDPRTGQRLPTAQEESDRADRESQRADHERQRADHERQRADQERQRADAEARRAAALEERLRRLQGGDSI